VAWKEYPLLGFMPDLPNTTEGACIITHYAVPTARGIGNGPVFTEASISALNTASLGGASLYTSAGVNRLYAGTATKLYEATPTNAPITLTDRSGTTYSASTTDTWAFDQFVDVTLAINYNDFLQASTGAAFSAVGGTPVPKASIIAVSGPPSSPFVGVFDFKDGTHTYRDGWFISAQADYTGWTTGVNNCALGRLLDNVPGPITAAIGYRGDFLVWKRTGMYKGTFIGPPDIWRWETISSDIGCIGKNCCVRADDVVYWGDDAGVWRYDGSYPQKVPGYVHGHWASIVAAITAASDTNRNFFRALWDKPKNLLSILAGLSADAGTVTADGFTYDVNITGLSYNTISGLWTKHTYNPYGLTSETNYAVEVIAPRVCISKNKKFALLSWTPAGSEPRQAGIGFWAFSDRVNSWVIKGVRPQWGTDDTTSNATVNVGDVSASQYSANFFPAGPFTDFPFRTPGKFDGMKAGISLAAFVFPNAGITWEILGKVSIDVERQGKS